MMSGLSYSQLPLAHWPGSAFMHGTDEIVSASPTPNYNLMGGLAIKALAPAEPHVPRPWDQS